MEIGDNHRTANPVDSQSFSGISIFDWGDPRWTAL